MSTAYYELLLLLGSYFSVGKKLSLTELQWLIRTLDLAAILNGCLMIIFPPCWVHCCRRQQIPGRSSSLFFFFFLIHKHANGGVKQMRKGKYDTREAVDSHPWSRSRPSWIGSWAAWAGEGQPWPWQSIGTGWSFNVPSNLSCSVTIK